MIREDKNDIILPTVRAKFEAVIQEICEVHKTGRPILVGTVSVENSEILSGMLKRQGIRHEVLNAKNHEKEAMIIAQAGKYGAVTIATNMAGRGTDILLGGNPDYMAKSEMRRQGYDEDLIYTASMHLDTQDEQVLKARALYHELYEGYKKQTDAEHQKVVAAGGLYIIGTERHEARRIDNQLRGRSGRQGDPGASRFYVALEDDLMRLFGGERIRMIIEKISGGEDIPLEYGMMTRQIEKAQKRIEERNYKSRSQVLKYDDVMNQQREVIYAQRRRVLMGEDIRDTIKQMLRSTIEQIVAAHCPGEIPYSQWDLEALNLALHSVIPAAYLQPLTEDEVEKRRGKDIGALLLERAQAAYEKKSAELEEAGLDMREIERVVLLREVDSKWMEHIDNMDQLRDGIGLRAYGQTDPVVAYQKEGFDMFDEMISAIQQGTVQTLFRVTVRTKVERVQTMQPQSASHGGKGAEKPAQRRVAKKVGRNDPCPCGSGKKYKNCCGRNA